MISDLRIKSDPPTDKELVSLTHNCEREQDCRHKHELASYLKIKTLTWWKFAQLLETHTLRISKEKRKKRDVLLLPWTCPCFAAGSERPRRCGQGWRRGPRPDWALCWSWTPPGSWCLSREKRRFIPARKLFIAQSPSSMLFFIVTVNHAEKYKYKSC